MSAHKVRISGEGPPLLLIGGLFVSHAIWDPLIPLLNKDFMVIAPDNRGIAEIPPGPYTTQQMADDLIHILDELGIDQVHVVGHSLGGAIAQILAITHKDRVITLGLCSAFDKLSQKNTFLAKANNAMMKLRLPMEGIIRLNVPALFSNCATPADIDTYIKICMGSPRSGFKHQIHACYTHDTTTRLHEISAPTKIIVGENDAILPPSVSERIHKGIIGSSLTVIPKVGHMLQYEATATLASELLHLK
ncbi:MAG: hypothetical protein SP1CHLAM54_03970 [Chlamydiia bacterium]|nr:hypothetical protein [Chlamydiia bacterium]MCH9615312.1 hypothetical protein [Chlamydiia bacterium]MCH9628366.1 hypothetical protein [Chlamydiia bacterium]